jgi:hypothetical protein
MDTNRVLGYLAAASAAFAFLLWAIPVPRCFEPGNVATCSSYERFFSPERLPAVAAFLVLSIILLIARAGNRRR